MRYEGDDVLVRMQQMIELCYESEGKFLGGC